MSRCTYAPWVQTFSIPFHSLMGYWMVKISNYIRNLKRILEFQNIHELGAKEETRV